METKVKKNLKTKLVDFATKRVVYHLIFWLSLLLMFLIVDQVHHGFFLSLIIETINIMFYAVVVYFNLLYLIPNYLSEKKFLLYSGLLILSVIIITPIKNLILFLLFSFIPSIQESLITDQKWIFLTTFFVAATSTILKITSDWMRYQRDRKELQTQTMQSELKFLKSQINPHFLFNTLNNLYALTLKKSDKAPEIVIKLSEMMRYMLYECNEKRVLLSKEVKYIQNYLDLESLRQSKNVSINFEVIGNAGDQKIAPLMFIPFLENSFKHGLNNQIAQGFVNIVLTIEDKDILFFMENSKSGSLPAQHHKRSGGIGLVNVKRRLALQYAGKHKLETKDNPNTYAVNLELNLS